MELQEDNNFAKYQIKSYDKDSVTINATCYHHSLIVSANDLITDWPPRCLTDLQAQHWDAVLALKPHLVLLGVAQPFNLPPASQLAPLYSNKIGIEVMELGAACRTFVALSAEGRNVVAALLLGS